MFPADNEEFWILYATYFSLFMIFLSGMLFSAKKKFFKAHLIILLFYSAIMLYILSDEENLKYGSSLVVLFIGGIFISIHMVILAAIIIYRKVSKISIPDKIEQHRDHI